MKLLFISSLLVAATNAADVDRRRINGITFADQAVEALNLVHKGQASQASSSTVLIKKGESDNKGGDDKSSRNKGGDDKSSRDDKSSNNKSSNSNSSSSESSGSRSSSRDGRGVCGESDDYCKNYDSSSFLNIKKEDGGNKGGDDKNKSSRDDKNKSSGSSKSKSSSSTGSSRDGGRRTDRCFRACETDRCTSDDRRRLACPDSTAASSDMKFVQKGQASPIQKLVWAAKGEDEGGDDKTSPDDKSDDKDKTSPDDKSDDKDKSSKSKSSSGPSGDDICKAPKNWCEGSSADDCDDACDKDSGCDKDERERLGCDKTSGSGDVAATKKLRGRKA